MDMYSPSHLIIFIVYVVVLIIPITKILNRTGFSGWWSLVTFIPLVNLVFLWIFASAKWPAQSADAAPPSR